MSRNPLISKYVRTGSAREGERRPKQGSDGQLDCIYLDTSALFLDEELVDKVRFLPLCGVLESGKGALIGISIAEGSGSRIDWVHEGVSQ